MSISSSDFKLIFDAAPGLYLILTPSLEIVAVSDSYLAATMTRREDILHKKLFEVFPDNPDDPKADGVSNLRTSLENVLKTKAAHQMAFQKYDIRRTDGSFEERYWSPVNKPVLENGEVKYIIHRVEDVTELVNLRHKNNHQKEDLRTEAQKLEMEIQKRTKQVSTINQQLEEQLQERVAKLQLTEEKLLYTMDNMMEAIQIIGFDWRYLYANKAQERIGRIPKDELLGFTMMEKYPGFEKSDVYQALKECMEERVPVHVETEFKFPDNTSAWFDVGVQPVQEGILVLAIEITERKKAEEEIRQMNQNLEKKVEERTSQFEIVNKELEAFSYSVSHDLRAPLRAINGYAKMLEEDYEKLFDEEGKRLLYVIQKNAKKMGDLIDDLLEFSRTGKKEVNKIPINFTDLAQNICNELSKTSAYKAAFTIKDLHTAPADYSLMSRVMENLISNAMKYSSKKPEPTVLIQSEQKDGKVIYSIQDNGVGFDMQYAGKLFGVFQRLHKPEDFEGTGVGLAIVKRIIVKHGGDVWADGKPNTGATFYFSLPLNQI